VAASALLSQASSDSEPSRYRIRLSGSQANILTSAGIDSVSALGTTGTLKKSSAERDTHSAVSSSKHTHQHGLFVPMQNMRQNVSEKVAQVGRYVLLTTASLLFLVANS